MERIMNLKTVSAKMDLRLNKAASGDYDNLWSYQKQEAFNKAVNDWVRRQKHGTNQSREGDEETSMRVDDLQVLLKKDNLTVIDKGLYVRSQSLPTDYLYYKRCTPIVSKGSCSNVNMKSHLKEEANVDDLISMCSFDFEETFHTIAGNRILLYHNKDFTVNKIELTYYRKPKTYDFKKLDTVVEFKDDICDILVDEACKIMASDIESINQKTLAQERAEGNN
jgi:hypothetical protein